MDLRRHFPFGYHVRQIILFICHSLQSLTPKYEDKRKHDSTSCILSDTLEACCCFHKHCD